ncbi:MAG TPA: DUF3696 domain-containing protein [Capsulimonadaceae bacterium]|jgi:predicted ATPase
MPFNIVVENYKCWEHLDLEFRPLTVLSGLNNSGKSSVIQALVLLRAVAIGERIIPLNGAHGIDLGRVEDVLTYSADANIQLSGSSEPRGPFSFVFSTTEEEQHERYLTLELVNGSAPICFASQSNVAFCYLSANRSGPSRFQALQSVPREGMGLGANGEFSADVLSALDFQHKVRPTLQCIDTSLKSEKTERLQVNLERWMRGMFPNLNIRADRNDASGIATLEFGRQFHGAEWFSPTNSGFGISYVLPIVLAGLIVPSDGVIVVENPEAHLHPAAQSFIGRFLATVAASGVHVILETHSDHVINGIRLACVDEHPIRHSDVCLYNFVGASDGQPDVEKIEINERGSLSTHPKYFFDQSEKDLARILKSRKMVA